jgi:hypothetical protein
MTNPTGLTYAELTEAFLERGDLLETLQNRQETLHDKNTMQAATIERLRATIERVRALTGYYDLNSGSAYAYVAADIRAALEATL